jgi:hypothetical protein
VRAQLGIEVSVETTAAEQGAKASAKRANLVGHDAASRESTSMNMIRRTSLQRGLLVQSR